MANGVSPVGNLTGSDPAGNARAWDSTMSIPEGRYKLHTDNVNALGSIEFDGKGNYTLYEKQANGWVVIGRGTYSEAGGGNKVVHFDTGELRGYAAEAVISERGNKVNVYIREVGPDGKLTGDRVRTTQCPPGACGP